MKKIVMTVATATLLFGGLAGCMQDNATGNYRNNAYETRNFDGNYNNRGYRGQGPVTDMMTPDGYGTRANNYNGNRSNALNGWNDDGRNNGYRANQNRPWMGRFGVTGNDRPGMVDGNGILRGRMHDGYRDNDRYGAMEFNRNYRQGANGVKRKATRNFDSQNRDNRIKHQEAERYHEDYDSRTAKQIAKRVKNVEGVDDVRVIVNDNDVVVGVEAERDLIKFKRMLNDK